MEFNALFSEKKCYHSLNEKRCEYTVYQRLVNYPFCQEHRYTYAQMGGLVDFQTIPLTPEQEEYLLQNLEAVKKDFEFELNQYKRFRPTNGDKKNEWFEKILEPVVIHLKPVPKFDYYYLSDYEILEHLEHARKKKKKIPIHKDKQNVHREDVRLAQNPMLFDLLKTNMQNVNKPILLSQLKRTLDKLYKKERLGSIKYFFSSCFDSSLEPNVSSFILSLEQNMVKEQEFSYLNPATQIITRFSYRDLAEKIIYRILQSKNRNELAKRLMQEVNEGIGYCMVGKITRMLNTFTGFDDFIQTDSRSLQEKIQDSMSDISRMNGLTILNKKEKAKETLCRLGVHYAEKQKVWLDAFEE